MWNRHSNCQKHEMKDFFWRIIFSFTSIKIFWELNERDMVCVRGYKLQVSVRHLYKVSQNNVSILSFYLTAKSTLFMRHLVQLTLPHVCFDCNWIQNFLFPTIYHFLSKTRKQSNKEPEMWHKSQPNNLKSRFRCKWVKKLFRPTRTLCGCIQ